MSLMDIQVGGNLHYESAASYLTTVLCSEPRDTDELRSDVHKTISRWGIVERLRRDPLWEQSSPPVRAATAAWTDDEVNRHVSFINRRFRDRSLAAKLAIPFLKFAQLGDVKKVHPALERMSLNDVVKHIAPRYRLGEPSNIKVRIFRPSKPVLTHAVAMEIITHWLSRELDASLDLYELLWNPGLLELMIGLAESYEPLFEKLNQDAVLHIEPADLIRFRARPQLGSKLTH